MRSSEVLVRLCAVCERDTSDSPISFWISQTNHPTSTKLTFSKLLSVDQVSFGRNIEMSNRFGIKQKRAMNNLQQREQRIDERTKGRTKGTSGKYIMFLYVFVLSHAVLFHMFWAIFWYPAVLFDILLFCLISCCFVWSIFWVSNVQYIWTTRLFSTQHISTPRRRRVNRSSRQPHAMNFVGKMVFAAGHLHFQSPVELEIHQQKQDSNILKPFERYFTHVVPRVETYHGVAAFHSGSQLDDRVQGNGHIWTGLTSKISAVCTWQGRRTTCTLKIESLAPLDHLHPWHSLFVWPCQHFRRSQITCTLGIWSCEAKIIRSKYFAAIFHGSLAPQVFAIYIYIYYLVPRYALRLRQASSSNTSDVHVEHPKQHW